MSLHGPLSKCPGRWLPVAGGVGIVRGGDHCMPPASSSCLRRTYKQVRRAGP